MRYLYYKVWQNFKKTPTNDMPATNAMFFIAICQFANIFIIHLLLSVNSLASMKFGSRREIYAFTVPMSLIVFIFDYLYLYRNRDKIYEKYKDESNKHKLIGNLLLALYIIISFALVFYFGPKYTASFKP